MKLNVNTMFTDEVFPPERHYLIGEWIRREAQEQLDEGKPADSIAFDITIVEVD